MKERQSIFFLLLRIFRSNKKIIQDVELTLSSLFQTQNSQSSYVEMSPRVLRFFAFKLLFASGSLNRDSLYNLFLGELWVSIFNQGEGLNTKKKKEAEEEDWDFDDQWHLIEKTLPSVDPPHTSLILIGQTKTTNVV